MFLISIFKNNNTWMRLLLQDSAIFWKQSSSAWSKKGTEDGLSKLLKSIRKRGNNTMNCDEGQYFLPHIFDELLEITRKKINWQL